MSVLFGDVWTPHIMKLALPGCKAKYNYKERASYFWMTEQDGWWVQKGQYPQGICAVWAFTVRPPI